MGHDSAHDYRPALDSAVYASLLDLARITRVHVGGLGPRDQTDIQSLIGVVGEYQEDAAA